MKTTFISIPLRGHTCLFGFLRDVPLLIPFHDRAAMTLIIDIK
jgi:hypothetical protein